MQIKSQKLKHEIKNYNKKLKNLFFPNFKIFKNLAILENYYINNNVNAFKSFFIIYEKYMKRSFEQNVDLVIIKPFYFILF